MEVEDLVKKVFSRGFAVGTGDTNSCKVRMVENGASGFFNDSFFIDDFIGFKKKKGEEEEKKRGEDKSEG